MARKYRTHGEFVHDLHAVNPSVEILEPFVKLQQKVKVRCKIDGYVWSTLANGLLRGSGCIKCYGARRTKTHEQFIEELSNINNNIKILSNYTRSEDKVTVECLIDGHTWETEAAALLKGHGCPVCAGNKKRTHEQFVADLALVNPKVSVIGRYISTEKRILVRCNVDGHEWSPVAAQLLKGKGCIKCSTLASKKSQSEFVREVSIVNKDIIVIGKYEHSHTNIDVKCAVDGYEWSPSPSSLLRGFGCPLCAKNGFNTSKISTFYIYEFGEYVGFGITSNMPSRNRQHKNTFKKNNIVASLVRTYENEGKHILDLERYVKKNVPIVDSGVPCFRVEAVSVEYKDILLNTVDTFIEKLNSQRMPSDVSEFTIVKMVG